MSNMHRVLSLGLAWVAGMLLWGCGLNQGVNIPGDDGTSTSMFRVESELIPNVKLVREDTMPDWRLGRYAFASGADRLLVVTNITSFGQLVEESRTVTSVHGHSARPTVQQTYETPGEITSRRDAAKERVWITLPVGTAVGEELDLEYLQSEYLVGYDAGDLPDGRMFVQPNAVRGKVTLIEDRSDSVIVDVNMLVEPKRRPSWRVKQVMTVPVTTAGIHAQRMIAGHPLLANPVEERLASLAALSDAMPTPSTGGAAARMTIKEAVPGEGAQTQPDGEAAATQPTTQPANKEQSVVGRWILPRSKNGGNWEYRFQFEADGRCVFMSQRVTFTPVPRYGTYQVRGNYVVINVERAEPGLMKMPYVTLHRSWDRNGNLVLAGDIWPDGFMNGLRMVLEPANFPDMFTSLPGRDAR